MKFYESPDVKIEWGFTTPFFMKTNYTEINDQKQHSKIKVIPKQTKNRGSSYIFQKNKPVKTKEKEYFTTRLLGNAGLV